MTSKQVDAAAATATELGFAMETVQLEYSVSIDVRNVSFGIGGPVDDRAKAEVCGSSMRLTRSNIFDISVLYDASPCPLDFAVLAHVTHWQRKKAVLSR